MIDIYNEQEEDRKIPLPRMSEFLLEEFMLPMHIDARTLSEGTGIPLWELQAMLRDEEDVTPENSKRLGSFFGVSDMLFYDIQEDLKERSISDMRELQYA